MEKHYGLKHKNLFCPSIPSRKVRGALSYHDKMGIKYRIIGYSYWVPRYVDCYKIEIPAEQNTSTFTAVDTKSFSGPKKVTDSIGRNNPIMTDQVGMRMSNPLSIVGKNKDFTVYDLSHKWNNTSAVMIQVFVDGRIEKVKGEELKVRYGYGSSPDGCWILR